MGMVETTKEQVKEALWEAGLDADEDINWNYSGAGMFGETCFGIMGDEGDLLEFAVRLARMDDQMDLDWLRRMRADSLGRRTIFYWPGISFPEEELEDEADN